MTGFGREPEPILTKLTKERRQGDVFVTQVCHFNMRMRPGGPGAMRRMTLNLPKKIKVNIVRFGTNVRPLLLYELKMLRVASPKSKVQQRITTKKITNNGCGSLYIFKNVNRWQPLLTKRALVFG